MNKSVIEVNRDFKSIASSWLGIGAADLKTKESIDINREESISFSKVKIKSSHKEKTNDNIQTVFLEKKKKNDQISAALFVSGKLKRKLEKAKRREHDDKHEDKNDSSVIQEKYLDEDSKVSVIQNKSKVSNLAERTDSSNSVENIRRLLAVTKTKNHRKKLRKKLKKLLSKSMRNEPISDGSESTKLPSQFIETVLKKERNKEKSTQKPEQTTSISNMLKKKKKTVLSSQYVKNEESLLTSCTNSKQNQVANVSKKLKRKMDGDECFLSLDVHSTEGQISYKNHDKKHKIDFLSDKHAIQIHNESDRKSSKKKRNCENTDDGFNAQLEKTKDKSEKCLPQTQEVVCKSRKEKGVNKSCLLGKKHHAKLKRKQMTCNNVNDFSPIKLKKHEASSAKPTSELHVNSGLSAESTDMPSEEETRKQHMSYKRKRSKKRSKQKNIRKDHRPDHMKPSHLRANASVSEKKLES